VFDLANSVGLALTKTTTVAPRSLGRAEASVPRSNLQKVDSAGHLSDVLSSGSALISQFMIAPSGKLYVLFSQKTNLITGLADYTNGCLLAEVNPTTGQPTAIDSTLSSISWNTSTSSFYNPPIQFDNAGAIYYRGQGGGSNAVLRKYYNGTTTDLFNDNISIIDFVINGDGSAIVNGTTTSSNISWVRKITTTGGLQNIIPSNQAMFVSKFPDNNIYLGLCNSPYGGVYRFLSSTTNLLDSNPWISTTTNIFTSVSETPTNDITGQYLAMGSYYGAVVNGLFTTTTSKVFGLTYSNSKANQLVRYYPTVSYPTTSVTAISLVKPVLSYLIISGTDSSANNKMVLYDTTSHTEQNLLPGYNIEIYHANYVATGNKIMFDGLDFSNNTVVIGQVSLTGGGISTVSLGTGSTARLNDFSSF
jgi:hypothetical protein